MGVLSQVFRAMFIIVCGLIFVGTALAEEKPLQLYEQKIKAGLVYNLLKYTDWPSNTTAAGELKVCLFGGDPFDGYLGPLEGRTAQQAAIAITRITQIKQASDCQVVIVPRAQVGQWPQLAEFLKNKSALTISDIRNFTHQGGMVEMTKEGEKINLYINKSVVEQADLNIQGRMLRLARLVGS